MNHLHRELAPISDAAWSEITNETHRSLTHFLAARKLVDFVGPLGYEAASIGLGRTTELAHAPADGVIARQRQVLPLVELRARFELARSEIDAIDRGACDPDLDTLVNACRSLALAEDGLIFNGYAEGGITGMSTGSPHDPISLPSDYERYPNAVARAIAVLKQAGVGGPYAIAMGPVCYAGVIESTDKGGYPVLQHLGLILGGPVVWAPAVDGATVLSERGGDFALTVGQDATIAYVAHDADSVTLELQESLAYIGSSPEAAIALHHEV